MPFVAVAPRAITLIFLFFSIALKAQVPEHYTPLFVDSSDVLGVKYFEKQYKKEVDTIAAPSGKAKKIIAEQCSLRYEVFHDAVINGEMLTDSKLDTFVQSVTKKIIAVNPVLNNKVRVYVSRNVLPNAYCMGNGLVVVNLGLMARLQNEDQLAFVLCHEFSHQMLQHSNQNIYKNAIWATDKDLKRKINKTLKEEYNVTEKIGLLLLPGILKNYAYSRTEELQADSLGMVFFANTMYDLTAATATMDILDKIDEEMKSEPLELKTYFSLPQVPARPEWYEYQESSLGSFGEAETDSLDDSLKTHPDCKIRKEILGKYISTYKNHQTENHPAFDYVAYSSRCEAVQSLYDKQNLGRSMFIALRMLEINPKDAYNRSMVALNLATLSKLKKERNAGYYTSLPNPHFSENYNRFLTFIQELSPKEAGEISYWMVNPARTELLKEEVYYTALIYSAYASGHKEEYKTLRKDYYIKFPAGRYANTVAQLPELK